MWATCHRCRACSRIIQLLPEAKVSYSRASTQEGDMDAEKTRHIGKDNSPPEEKKPIIDQMTDLAAQAAGTLTEAAVKAVAKKAKKAVARQLPRPVKKAAKTVVKAAKAKKTAKKTA